eukprot:scaffold75432_cov76-Phaeocystis_antarctica.AAC.1
MLQRVTHSLNSRTSRELSHGNPFPARTKQWLAHPSLLTLSIALVTEHRHRLSEGVGEAAVFGEVARHCRLAARLRHAERDCARLVDLPVALLDHDMIQPEEQRHDARVQPVRHHYLAVREQARRALQHLLCVEPRGLRKRIGLLRIRAQCIVRVGPVADPERHAGTCSPWQLVKDSTHEIVRARGAERRF